MTNYLQLTITALGGLALFVYGMGLMSDGLKETAGEKLKAALGYMTRNRIFAILAGTAVTALIQSSSATSVMTVGFVNAGLISLRQAIGVIFGTNIGTTVTGQIVSLKLNDLALPAVTLGVIGLMVAKRTVTRGVWRTILGFGLLFFGMTFMSHELKVLAQEPRFVAFFSRFDCTPGASGFLPPLAVLGAVAVGTLCTMVVQSSSATIGITIALAETGVISLWTAVPIVLGDNIGTTITAALAAIGGNANARRTALAHALFNVFGTILVLLSFGLVFTNADGIAAPAFYHLVDLCTDGNGFAGETPGRHVAMAHTIFNVANVIVQTPFIPLLARLCTRLIGDDRTARVQALEPHLLEAPALALHAARLALGDMTRRAWTIASVALNNCLGRATVDEESVQNAEREIDEMQSRIRDYLVAISQRKLTERQAQALPELVHCVNDAERISDIAVKIYRKTARIQRQGLSEDILAATSDIIARLRVFAHETTHVLRKGGTLKHAPAVTEDTITRAAKALSRQYSETLANAAGDRPNDTAFLTVLAGIRDVNRHIGNIAERVPALG